MGVILRKPKFAFSQTFPHRLLHQKRLSSFFRAKEVSLLEWVVICYDTPTSKRCTHSQVKSWVSRHRFSRAALDALLSHDKKQHPSNRIFDFRLWSLENVPWWTDDRTRQNNILSTCSSCDVTGRYWKIATWKSTSVSRAFNAVSLMHSINSSTLL